MLILQAISYVIKIIFLIVKYVTHIYVIIYIHLISKLNFKCVVFPTHFSRNENKRKPTRLKVYRIGFINNCDRLI